MKLTQKFKTFKMSFRSLIGYPSNSRSQNRNLIYSRGNLARASPGLHGSPLMRNSQDALSGLSHHNVRNNFKFICSLLFNKLMVNFEWPYEMNLVKMNMYCNFIQIYIPTYFLSFTESSLQLNKSKQKKSKVYNL